MNLNDFEKSMLLELKAKLNPNYCQECEDHKGTFYPSHTPSPSCQSGKKPHCTCDSCF